jgi:hypothetical protein
MLIVLTLKRSHVTAAGVLRIGTRLATLVGLQQIALFVGAAAGVACVNCRASREQRNSLGWPAVVPQRAELGVGVVQIARAAEIAGVIAAQVVAMRGHTTAVSARIIRDNAVTDRHRAPGVREVRNGSGAGVELKETASAASIIPAEGTIINFQHASIENTPAMA